MGKIRVYGTNTTNMTDQNRKTIGETGEKVAANFLRNKGYEILDMNFQNSSGRRIGEIDIVAKDPKEDEIVFVEVKTRESRRYSDTLPEENINHAKLRRLDKIASIYLRNKKMDGCAYRFDAVSVWLDYATRTAKIKHIRNL